ncbi:phage terminase small subunit P27 family [Spirosoma aureum]|uniref:Phage terminase small subunit P27 family n=1 Tax=Spirosoma aureum TaxID=2692134 RepID=A0A6G9AIE8_9BACT|nr:phage terminase small subunit P27 family [Spirosoma aureum]QIP12241.1 phage terminase small subunit P27 family [Spirosoma aureum]
MKRGAKPIPTALKSLTGTLRTDRMNSHEPPVSPLPELPAPPDWLNPWARDEWVLVAGWLHSVGLLTATDQSIIGAYCQQLGIFREAEEQLKLPGARVIVTDKGYEMPSPWVAIGNKALMQAMKIASEYGLTPSSRSRIQLPKEEEEDPFETFLRRN